LARAHTTKCRVANGGVAKEGMVPSPLSQLPGSVSLTGGKLDKLGECDGSGGVVLSGIQWSLVVPFVLRG